MPIRGPKITKGLNLIWPEMFDTETASGGGWVARITLVFNALPLKGVKREYDLPSSGGWGRISRSRLQICIQSKIQFLLFFYVPRQFQNGVTIQVLLNSTFNVFRSENNYPRIPITRFLSH
jgi:hypothetical protein